MMDTGIGRMLVGSLHGAIFELLPMRLSFYEEWFRPSELRDGHMGRAPLGAVLSFLRQEGETYAEVTRHAGICTAAWWVASLSPVTRAVIRRAPRWARGRLALREARRMVAHTFRHSQAAGQWRAGQGLLTIGHSIFCDVRERGPRPLCGFYAAAVEALCAELGMPVEVTITSCRAVDADTCRLAIASRPGDAA